LVALSSRRRTANPDHVGRVLLVVYQVGLVATACVLTFEHVGRCAAVFNCMVMLAADLFRALVWPVYWLAGLIA